MIATIKVRTENLSGAALCWAIESIEGVGQLQTEQLQLPFARQVDGSAAERLVAKYDVWLERGWSNNWLANARADRDPCERQPGETRAIAVCRAVVAVRIGNTVSIPAELIN